MVGEDPFLQAQALDFACGDLLYKSSFKKMAIKKYVNSDRNIRNKQNSNLIDDSSKKWAMLENARKMQVLMLGIYKNQNSE